VVAIKERLLTLLARAGSTQPKLKVCLQVIRDHERTIQALQQQLEDHRKSSDSTLCHAALDLAAWANIASEGLKTKAQTGQTASSALMRSRVKQQPEHKEQHPPHVKLDVIDKGMTDEEEEVKRGDQASSSTPNSLFPWPKPKFRMEAYGPGNGMETESTLQDGRTQSAPAVEQYQRHKRAPDASLLAVRSPSAAQYAAMIRGRM